MSASCRRATPRPSWGPCSTWRPSRPRSSPTTRPTAIRGTPGSGGWRSWPGPRAGWLTVGRPRREAARVALRVALRGAVLEAHGAVLALGEAYLSQARRHRDTLMADFTYLQPAQPTTFGYVLAGHLQPVLRHLHAGRERLQLGQPQPGRRRRDDRQLAPPRPGAPGRPPRLLRRDPPLPRRHVAGRRLRRPARHPGRAGHGGRPGRRRPRDLGLAGLRLRRRGRRVLPGERPHAPEEEPLRPAGDPSRRRHRLRGADRAPDGAADGHRPDRPLPLRRRRRAPGRWSK